jgi:hypothetical protein
VGYVFLIALLLSSTPFSREVKTTFNSTIVRDGKATDHIYNYLDPSSDGKDTWTMECVEQPCYLFHKGDKVTLTMSDKVQKIRTGRFSSEKFMVGTICGAPSGCFKAAFAHSEPSQKEQ